MWNEGRTQELSGTIWINANFDNCSSKIEFLNNGEFQHFYCGMNQISSGKYLVEGDTLTLDEYKISEVPVSLSGSDKPYLRFRYTWIRNGSTLEMINFSDIKYKTEEQVNDPQHNYILQSK